VRIDQKLLQWRQHHLQGQQFGSRTRPTGKARNWLYGSIAKIWRTTVGLPIREYMCPNALHDILLGIFRTDCWGKPTLGWRDLHHAAVMMNPWVNDGRKRRTLASLKTKLVEA
jgi:hypothetical protein